MTDVGQSRISARNGTRACQPDTLPALHPAWRAFVQYCGELKHGEIERLSIQDGLPVLAEMTKKKVKFT